MTSPSKRLFVGSLPYRYTEGQLLSLFIPYGKVVAVRIIHNRWGKSRGLGYVEFDNLDSAVAAKAKLHNFAIEDRTIIVDFSKPDPMDTPEGQERHAVAQSRRDQFKSRFTPKSSSYENSSDKKPYHSKYKKPYRPSGESADKPYRPGFKKFSAKPSSSHSDRQSVYDQRHHHSRVGAKFASRNRKSR